MPPLLSPTSAQKDRKKGFSIAFEPQAATIETEPRLQLRMAPRNVHAALQGKSQPDEACARICLQGKTQQDFLVSHCAARGKSQKPGPKHQWRVQLDRYGHWQLLFPFEVGQPASVPTELHSPITVKSCDPGVRTPFAIYSLDGIVTNVGNQHDGKHLDQLCRRIDKLASRQQQRRTIQPLPRRRQPPPPPLP